MTLLDFLILALALRVVVFCWFKASLWPFPDIRATVEAYEGQEPETFFEWLYTLGGELWTALKCPYCVVHHCGALLAIPLLCYRSDLPWLPRLLAGVGVGWAAGQLVWLTDWYLPDDLSYHRRVVSNYDGPSPDDAATAGDLHRDDEQAR